MRQKWTIVSKSFENHNCHTVEAHATIYKHSQFIEYNIINLNDASKDFTSTFNLVTV